MAMVTETREVRGFEEVSLRGYGDVLIEQGEGPESLVIEADQEILQKVSSEVRGGRLILGFRMPWYEWMTWWLRWALLPSKRIRYHLKAVRVRGLLIAGSGSIRAEALSTDTCRLRITGSGKIVVRGLKAEAVDASIAGSGDIRVGGEATHVSASITGSGSLDADGVKARSARVGISGSGGVAVAPAETLDARITGSGGVSYRGSPKVSSAITGSGRIIQRG